jgi:hypothetical protein
MTPRIITLTALAAALALSACGKMGELERPGTKWRDTSGESGADRAQREASDPGTAPDTVDPRDRTTDPAPARTLPIPGQSPNPGAAPPRGALPDPYNDPR